MPMSVTVMTITDIYDFRCLCCFSVFTFPIVFNVLFTFGGGGDIWVPIKSRHSIPPPPPPLNRGGLITCFMARNVLQNINNIALQWSLSSDPYSLQDKTGVCEVRRGYLVMHSLFAKTYLKGVTGSWSAYSYRKGSLHNRYVCWWPRNISILWLPKPWPGLRQP